MKNYLVTFLVVMQHNEVKLIQNITVGRGETLIQAVQTFMKQNYKAFAVHKEHEIELISFEVL